jgi:toxin ParE1/3/4
MSGYVLRPLAKKDLEEIADYTFEQWGPEQEEIYLRMLARTFRALAENPLIGRPFDEVASGLRKRLAGQHIVLYFITDDGIDVVRILHHSMDVERHEFDLS